jgi:hypothetical protein
MEKFEIKLDGLSVSSSGTSIVKSAELAATTEKTPIYLNIDTGVDYAAIATGTLGLLVAALAAWFTLSVQRNQIQANVSNLRHHWMSELRACGSEFLQMVSLLINNLNSIEGYKGSDDYVSVYTKVVILQAKIELLLSRDDATSEKLRSKVAVLLTKVKRVKFNERDPGIFKTMAELRDLFRAELEKAWTDVKNDLGINKKFFGFRFVSKNK